MARERHGTKDTEGDLFVDLSAREKIYLNPG